MTLTEFLLARIAEDEGNAADCNGVAGCYVPDALLARALAECDAKRRVVSLYTIAEDLRPDQDGRDRELAEFLVDHYERLILPALALPFADHSDYRDEWKP